MFLPSRLWVNRWTWNHMVQRRFGRVGFLEFLGSFSAARWSFSHSFAVRTGSIWILATSRWEATSSQIVILRQTWRETASGSNLKGCVNNVKQMFRSGLFSKNFVNCSNLFPCHFWTSCSLFWGNLYSLAT